MRLFGFLKAPQTPWHEPNLHRHGIEIKCVAQVSAQNRGANLGHRANDSAESKSRLFDSVAASRSETAIPLRMPWLGWRCGDEH